MNKKQLIASMLMLFAVLLFLLRPARASWTEYKEIIYMDFDGDLAKEIVIKANHGPGTNHYIEDIRIFKDEYPQLKLIFSARTLDSYFGATGPDNYDIVSEVKFTEQTPENNGVRDMIVSSKKIYYKDSEHKVVDRKEELGTITYKWNGESFSAKKGEIIASLAGEEISVFLKQLNSQGVIVTYDDSIKKDEVTGNNSENHSFYLKGSDSWYFLYKADINNDGAQEYIVCSAAGSGGFFSIDAIYTQTHGKLKDIFDEIKLPMRRLIRDAEKEDYDLEEGYVGFMNGNLIIEKTDGKVYFTLEKITRKYETAHGGKFEDDFNLPEGYKFLCENGTIKLVERYVGDKIYK